MKPVLNLCLAIWPNIEVSHLYWQNDWHRCKKTHWWVSLLTWGKGTNVVKLNSLDSIIM